MIESETVFRLMEIAAGFAILLAFWTPIFGQKRMRPQWALSLSVLAYVVVLIRTAWLCDDAFINFRTIDHLFSGHGLVFNVGERVQTYTATAWTLLLSAIGAVTGELPFTTILTSIFVSTVAVWILVTKSTDQWQVGVLAALALTSSKAFVDFSTSGLENPLSFLLLAVFLTLYFRSERGPRDLFLLSFVASLAVLNRMDTLLLYLPVLVLTGFRSRSWRNVLALLFGFTAFFCWELFSLVYYGFLVPNTAYAKLNTGIPATELAVQGLRYYRNSFMVDPLTLSAIGVAVLSPLFWRRRSHFPIVLGVLLYMAYIVKVGGSFISGRHFATPLFASVWLLAGNLRCERKSQWLIPAAAVTLAALLVSPTPTVFSGLLYGGQFGQVPYPTSWTFESGIEDSRFFYYRNTGLLRRRDFLTGGNNENHWLLRYAEEARRISDETGRLVIVDRGIGVLGTRVGDKVHILDPVALADPLLARLPARRDVPWRIGHFERAIPEGYFETLESGQNLLFDPALATYYEHLSLIVSGEIFEPRRLLGIFKFNLGSYTDLVDRDFYRHPPASATMANGIVEGLVDPGPGGRGRSLPEQGLIIKTGGRVRVASWSARLSPARTYEFAFYRGRDRVAAVSLRTAPGDPGNLGDEIVEVPAAATSSSYDRIWVRPLPRDQASHQLGAFRAVLR